MKKIELKNIFLQKNNKLPDEKQVERAYFFWKHNKSVFKYESIDNDLAGFLSPGVKSSPRGWLRRARKALLLSGPFVAEKMNISRSAYMKLEKNDINGTISINSLAVAAEALNCELVLAIRPKKKILFSQVIWQSILPTAERHSWVKTRPAVLQGQALAAIAKKLMDSQEFRRQNNWTERKHEKSL